MSPFFSGCVQLPSPGLAESHLLSILPLRRGGVHNTALSKEILHILSPFISQPVTFTPDVGRAFGIE